MMPGSAGPVLPQQEEAEQKSVRRRRADAALWCLHSGLALGMATGWAASPVSNKTKLFLEEDKVQHGLT